MRKTVISSYGDGEVGVVELYGSVLAHQGTKGYVFECLKEAPDDMEFVLIERKQRTARTLSHIEHRNNNKIAIIYTDGTEDLCGASGEPVRIVPEEKIEDTSD